MAMGTIARQRCGSVGRLTAASKEPQSWKPSIDCHWDALVAKQGIVHQREDEQGNSGVKFGEKQIREIKRISDGHLIRTGDLPAQIQDLMSREV